MTRELNSKKMEDERQVISEHKFRPMTKESTQQRQFQAWPEHLGAYRGTDRRCA